MDTVDTMDTTAKMTRAGFIEHLRDGHPATEGVRLITGVEPEIITIQAFYVDDMSARRRQGNYVRYGIMMAGSLMAAIVILELSTGDVNQIDLSYMERIRAGEPCGAVIKGMHRRGHVIERGSAIQCVATLMHDKFRIGVAQEIFTESLFNEQH